MAYNADSIQVRDFRTAARMTPGMYIGADGQDATFNCFLEILNNACDEAQRQGVCERSPEPGHAQDSFEYSYRDLSVRDKTVQKNHKKRIKNEEREKYKKNANHADKHRISKKLLPVERPPLIFIFHIFFPYMQKSQNND